MNGDAGFSIKKVKCVPDVTRFVGSGYQGCGRKRQAIVWGFIQYRIRQELLYSSYRYLIIVVFSFFFLLFPASVSSKNVDAVFSQNISLGKKAFQNGKYLEAMKHFLQAKRHGDEYNSPKERCEAIYNIGLCYYFISENGEALKCYYDAYKICMDKNLGWKMETNILNGIAGVYFDDENYNKSYEIVKRGYDESFKKKDSLVITTYALDMALIANKRGRFKESEYYINAACRYNIRGEYFLMKVLTVKAEAMFMQKKYDAVVDISQKLLKSTVSTKDDKSIILIYLISIYSKLHQPDMAFKCANEAKKMVSIGNKPCLYESMSQLYREQRDFKHALEYQDSFVVYNDSLVRINNRQLTEKSHIKLEVFKIKTDMDKQMSRMRQQHQIFLLLLCISILVVLIGLIVIWNQRVKARQTRQLMLLKLEKGKHEKALAEEQMKETELIAHYQHEIMARSLEQKKKELSTSTMFISLRNKLIGDLLMSLSDIKEAKGTPALNTLVQHLKHLLKESSGNDDFLMKFEAANPDFIKKLQTLHPNLSSSDLRFLAYMRSNLSLKDIASLLNINPDSCKRHKIRLSKKLGLSSSADLYGYIIEL